MTSRDFCYWLQGFFEINGVRQNGTVQLTVEQTVTIRAHLDMVFKHEIDPSMGDAAHQDVLNKIHETAKKAEEKAEKALKGVQHIHSKNAPIRC
jgi:hypothetical protein